MHRGAGPGAPGAGAGCTASTSPPTEIEDGEREWPCWADGKSGPRRLTAITRTELHDHGVVVAGEPVAGQIPYVTPEELVGRVRAELPTVWLPATDKRRPWLDDALVDLRPDRAAAGAGGDDRGRADDQDPGHRPARATFDVPEWLRQDMLARRRGWAADTGCGSGCGGRGSPGTPCAAGSSACSTSRPGCA